MLMDQRIAPDDPNLIEAFNENRFAADALDGAEPDSAEGKALRHVNNALLKMHEAGVKYPARKPVIQKGSVLDGDPLGPPDGGTGSKRKTWQPPGGQK
jgi:hypothetical protein